MKKKIEKLTAEQESKLSTYRDKWLKIGLSTQNCDRSECEKLAAEIYKVAGLDAPKIFIWLDSPHQGAVAAHLMTHTKFAPQVRAQVRDQVGDQVGAQVWAQVGAQVWDQVGDQVGDQVRAQVWDQVGAQVGAQVRDQVGDQVGDQVRDQVRDQVGDQVRAQVRAQVRDQVRAQVRDQVWDQVGDQVWAQVRDQVRDQVNRCGYGSHDANWLGFYEFFLNECNLEVCKKLISLTELSKHCGWWWPFTGLVIFTERPTEIHLTNGRMHFETGPAIKYRDGFSVYGLGGVRVPSWVIETPKENIDPKQVLSIENTEQRTAIMKFIGLNKFLKQLGAEEIDNHKDYKLYYLTTEGRTIGPYLFMRCPSTGREFLEGVGNAERNEFIDKSIMTCEDALKWRAQRASKNLMTKFGLKWDYQS